MWTRHVRLLLLVIGNLVVMRAKAASEPCLALNARSKFLNGSLPSGYSWVETTAGPPQLLPTGFHEHVTPKRGPLFVASVTAFVDEAAHTVPIFGLYVSSGTIVTQKR